MHFICINNNDPFVPAVVLPCNTDEEIESAASYLADEEIESAPIWSGDPDGGEAVKTRLLVLAEDRDDDEEEEASGFCYYVSFSGSNAGLSPWSTGHTTLAEAEESAADARCRGLDVVVAEAAKALGIEVE